MDRRSHQSTTSFMVSLCVHVFVLLLISSVWFIGNRTSSIQLEGSTDETAKLVDQTINIALDDVEQVLVNETAEVPDDRFEDIDFPALEIVELTVPDLVGLSAINELVSEPMKKQSGSAGSYGASFFGISPVGDRIVYIIDMSPSMQVGKYQRRFDRAVNEVIHSVEQLREDQEFFVIMFSFTTVKVKLGTSDDFCFATNENKASLEERLRSLGLSSGTDPREAIVAALKLKPSCIYLLSDGEFNGNQYRNGVYRDRITAFELSKKHNVNRCPIHTVGLEDPRTQSVLSQISEASGGTYVFVPSEE